MTAVLVVDDHPLFRRGLVALLKASGFTDVRESASATEAIALASERPPEIVLLDLGLPDMAGHLAARRLMGEHPETRIVVVSMHDDAESVRHALDAGAIGYVVKDAPPDQVITAVRAAQAGASLLSSGVARPVPAADAGRDPIFAGMTPRERSVARLLAQGLPNRIIAERLGVSSKTVANYVSSLLLKLDAEDRHDAARRLRDAADRAGD